MRIGVIGLQGAVSEHIEAVKRAMRNLGIDGEAIWVDRPEHLNGIDGIIIPGGESTTIGKLMERFGLDEPVRAMVERGKPVWGTCAGMIMLSRDVQDARVRSLDLMDLRVVRNAFGRQIDSFEVDLPVPALGDKPFRAVFIRAPIVASATNGVEVLARLPDGRIAAARQGKLLATAFHPELTDDPRFHRLFLKMAEP